MPKDASKQYPFSKRWAKELEEDGHVQISTFFLENYHRLKPYSLTYGEAMFVVHLMQHKWGVEAPYPGYKTLAKRMAVSDKTARRLAKSLEDKKYLVREIREAQHEQVSSAKAYHRAHRVEENTAEEKAPSGGRAFTPMKPSNYIVEPLDPAKHRRDEFDCGVPALNDYLRERAGQDMRRHAAGCWVLCARAMIRRPF